MHIVGCILIFLGASAMLGTALAMAQESDRNWVPTLAVGIALIGIAVSVLAK